MKSKDELGEKLCEYCPLDEDERGVKSGPNGPVFMCELHGCKKAYENYKEENNE
jgi:hypothetical protein